MTIEELVEATRTLPAEAPLVFSTADGPIGAGYHVTELKLAHIDSIDCGAQTDSWTEATLQLLDGKGRTHMPIGKFTSILDQSIRQIDDLGSSPLHIEFAHGNAGLQIFEPAVPEIVYGTVLLKLGPIHAQCKPATKGKISGEITSCCDALPTQSAIETSSENNTREKETAGMLQQEKSVSTETGCCGGPAPSGVDACCVKDADAKATGEAGCGCNSNVIEGPSSNSLKSSSECCG